jgi:leucyl-tRNA---protein transferase
MLTGWRRFGFSLFKPECLTCSKCQSLRVDVNQYRPNQSQKRAWNRNEEDVRVTVGLPSVSSVKLELYDKFHKYQAGHRGWPTRAQEAAADYLESFVDNPFVTQEWCYFLGKRLIGVGYVDHLPIGLSAIYFYYDPDLRDRSLGTFNVMSVIAAAREQNLPHVYLGYYVEGCLSLEYKKKFRPNEIFSGGQDAWLPFVA